MPSGVKFHNVTTGKTSAAGASVEINGGTKFYLSAPITQAADVNATFSATMKGTIVKDYSAYKITQQQRGIGHHLIKENGKDVVEDCHNTLPMVKALNAPYAQHFSLPTLIIKNNHNKIEFD